MAAGSSVKQRLREYLAEAEPTAITEAVWRDLLNKLSPVSESYLRDLLRQTGLPIDQPYAGIRQHNLTELEQSLGEMLRVYIAAKEAADKDRARYCRKQVIAAKDRAKFFVQNERTPGEKRSLKKEMVDWMLVWLDNPEVFPVWVEARKKVMAREALSPDEHS